MKTSWALRVAAWVLVLAVGIVGTAPMALANVAGYIQVRGSDTMVNLGQQWAEQFMEEYPAAFIAVTGGGSGTGIAALINNTTDVAQASRAMTQTEMAQAAQRGVQVWEFIAAQDGLAIAVHAQNPIDRLTIPQLKQIFTGEITHWSELGWPHGGAISVYSRQSNSGTYVYVNERVMDGEDWAPGTRFMPGSAAINEALRTDASGIGYYGIGYVDGAKALEVADADGIYWAPTKENVDQGRYPISRPLYLYTNGAPSGWVLHYLDWILSDTGQQVVEAAGFYRLNPGYVEANARTYAALGLERTAW